ncbi:phosphatase PAP2 family protein [Candidatus Methylomirabilis sp.]|uniref:phosphatase PAP2 family protein n=1 Tax=Candidatus Methylomirabilis sp. TaxID=2032687 RepID=UPI002A694915|nr:phosphatase PAP2 family protein [Candidatus Methylomirabilis sp.]
MSVLPWLERLREWDEAGFHLINGSLRNRVFDLLMPLVSNKWNFAIPVGALLVYVLLFRPKRDRIIVISAIAVILLTDTTSQLLKDLFQRIRPCGVLNATACLRIRSFSFPSNHASNMFALATFLSYNHLRVGLLCFPAAVLVGYSRIYLGSHYPFDVLGGALWGVLIGLLSAVAIQRFIRPGGMQPANGATEKKDHSACGPETFQ